MRTYLLNAANGVKRVFWYRYDMGLVAGGGTLGNTLITPPDRPGQGHPRGSRLRTVPSDWMHGTLVGLDRASGPASATRHGTYTCVVRDASGTRRIYWNPFHRATVRLAPGAHHLHGLLGGTQPVKGGSRLTSTTDR